MQFIAKYQDLTLTSVYQPIFDSTMVQIGVEALVRISNTNGDTVRPDHFFHSDETSYTDKINVERLSRAIHVRNFAQSTVRHLNLFLNVLPNVGELFASEKVKDTLLAKRLQELNLSCEQIVMELVELNVESEERLKNAAHSLADNGFQIAVDDFGAQASTEQRVRYITPHIIKIDRSVMLDFENGDTGKMELVLSLANQIGAKTVIEGIETEQQLAAMQNLGFDMYQGYHLAMPKPIALDIRRVI
ncbi:EAL domain-containing protein [Vibrio syngnathi]|uniref:EAL domain-containing protein n=1 Tax=Vibrio syngnathi TaxID=3034029 RepID=A0AA34XQF6_9VIBR|nr:EAL domain-containing protein [Vibrio syngnathi]ARP40426.1 EAL domain-containing protein [Vibrio syngnathi]